MNIKELYTIPEGEKVTEKSFGKVLISSACSILLCMVCLVSTTWAWFSVSVENTENILQIGSPNDSVSVSVASGTVLAEENHEVVITHGGNSDDFDRKSTLYVTLTVNGTKSVYTALNAGNQYKQMLQIQVAAGQQCTLTWEASWFAPVNADLLVGNTITVEAVEPQIPSSSETEAASNASEVASNASEMATDE